MDPRRPEAEAAAPEASHDATIPTPTPAHAQLVRPAVPDLSPHLLSVTKGSHYQVEQRSSSLPPNARNSITSPRAVDLGPIDAQLNVSRHLPSRRPGPLALASVAKDDIVAPHQGESAPENVLVRDSWVSFASTAANRDSAAPSIFSVRASTASASTRYSVRQSSIESPISATSPLYQEKGSLPQGARYCCTFCDESFESKTEWKLHELEFHDRRERYVCTDCRAGFSRASLLAAHCGAEHGLQSTTAMTGAVQYSPIRNAWGCGFCATHIACRNDYLEHVGRHYDEGKEKSEWQHTRVIEGLLHQPKVEAAWTALINAEERARGVKLRFIWDPVTTGRSADAGESRSLQDMLEFFGTRTAKPEEVARSAYGMARIRPDGNVSDLVSKVFLRNPESAPSKTNKPSPEFSPVSPPGAVDDEVSPISPLTAPMRPATAPPQTLELPFSPSRSNDSPPAAAQRPRLGGLLPKTTGTAVRDASQSRTLPTTTFGSDPKKLAGSALSPSTKWGILRHIDSARDLGLCSRSADSRNPNRDEGVWRSRTKAATDIPPISLQAAPETGRSPQNALADLSPTTMNGTGLCTAKSTTLASVRPHTSSSTLSTRTGDGSRGFDDSMSEMVSDDNLSEPDSWLEFDGASATTKNWKRAFQETVERGMGRLWARYNHDWDSLIRQCVGERSSDASPFRDPSGLVRKGAASRNTYGRGLGLNAHHHGPGEEEDEDDGEGYRPASSQSKRSAGPAKRFACPFRKHDPLTYNMHDHEVCAIRSWSTISRLKEHLYRRHYKIHCQRCKQTFNNARELADHEMSVLGCEVIDTIPPGDITTYQEKQLKSRKHTTRRQTDEEKWRDIYGLLFPNEMMPSPYPEPAEDLGPTLSESHISLSFQHFLLTEMPRLFTQTAEEHAGRHIQAHEGLLMEVIPKIIQESLQRAFSTWQARGSELPPREASEAFMSFLPDTPCPLPYALGQSPAYQAPQLTAGMGPSFGQGGFSSGTAFVSDVPHASRADDSGYADGTFFTSGPLSGYTTTFAPQYGRGDWGTGLGLTDGSASGERYNMGSHFGASSFQSG